MTIPALFSFGWMRNKLRAGALLYSRERFARLFGDGDTLARSGNLDVMLRRIAIAVDAERRLRAKQSWAHDPNRYIGLRQCRIALRRMRTAEQRRKAA